MTEQKNARRATGARPGRRPTTSDKIVSSGLAVTTCVGLVGLLAWRAQQDAQATQVAEPQPATSSAGLTQQDLDAYAASLADRQRALDDYRNQLADAATRLQAIAAANGMLVTTEQAVAGSNPTGSTGAARPATASKPAPRAIKPQVRPQSAPALVAAPQTATRGS